MLKSSRHSRAHKFTAPRLHATKSPHKSQSKTTTRVLRRFAAGKPGVVKNEPASPHFVILGLGNKGSNYTNTRHNIGKDYVLKLSRHLGSTLDIERHDCHYSAPINLSKLPRSILDEITYNQNLPKPPTPPKPQQPQTHTQSASSPPIPSPAPSDSNPVPAPTAPTATTNLTSTTTVAGSPNTTSTPQTSSKKPKKSTPFVPITEFPPNITITLAHTDSFMNTSGKPIQRLLTGLRIPQQNLIILHDDLDLKSGHIRLKCGGSSGGQNGLNDTLNVLGHNSPFIRIRLGIGRPIHPNMDVSDFVLGKFSPPERENLKYIDQFALTAIAQTILYGHAKANEHMGNFRTSYDAMKKGVS